MPIKAIKDKAVIDKPTREAAVRGVHPLPEREIADVWRSMEKLEKKHEKEKDRLLKLSEISLILDSYDEIFSDFDPRPYSARALSQDFLGELKRGSSDKVFGGMQLTLMIPSLLKDSNKELLIEERLHKHFIKHYSEIKHAVSKIRKSGGILILCGAMLSTVAAFIYPLYSEEFLATLAVVFLEPAGWFAMWTGFDYVFHGASQLKADLEFYEKMCTSKISFIPY